MKYIENNNNRTNGQHRECTVSAVYRLIAVLIMSAFTIAAALITAPWTDHLNGSLSAFADEGSSTDSVVDMTGQGVAGGAYEVKDYIMTATVGKDHSITVDHELTVNIPDTLQRVDFSIPSGSFRMRNINVEDLAFSSKVGTENSTVTILDPAGLSVGVHTYRLHYEILEFADRDPAKDIFYYSVLLPEWRQPIANLSITVNFPDDFPCGDIQYFAGQFGVQDTENRLNVEINPPARMVTITGEKIPENFGITLKAQLDDGYWQGALDGVRALLSMALIMGIVTLVLLVMWIIGGRDPKFKRTVETRPIEGVSPVELGYIFNSRMDVRDLVRMILYFGTKGYLKISEYEPKRYRLIRLKAPDGEEKLLRNAYNILFEDVYKNRGVDMDDIGERLVRITGAIKDDVAAGYSSKDMLAYTPLSRGFRITGIILISIGLAAVNALKYSYQYLPVHFGESVMIGAAAALLLSLLCIADDRKYSSNDNTGRLEELIAEVLIAALALYVSISLVRHTGHILIGLIVFILTCVAAFLTVIMRARGKGNAALVMRFRQLRRFIYHPTPKELLENYLADNDYYYDMMLYALTFGGEESWAISFLTLDVPEPEWYSDDIEGQAFSNLKEKPATVDIAHDLRSFARTIESAYTEMMRRNRSR